MIHVVAQKQLNRHGQNSGFETTEILHEAFIKLQKQNAIVWKNRNQLTLL